MSASKSSASLRLSTPSLQCADSSVASPNDEQKSTNPPAAVNAASTQSATGPVRHKKTNNYRPSLSVLLQAPIRSHHLDECVVENFYTPQPPMKTYPFPQAQRVNEILHSDSTFHAIDAVHASGKAILESAKQLCAQYESHVKIVADADVQLRDDLRNFNRDEIVKMVMKMMGLEGRHQAKRAIAFLDDLNKRLTASGRDVLHFSREGWYFDLMFD